MSWNNRVVITEFTDPDNNTEYVASIHEAYYNETKAPSITEAIVTGSFAETKEQALAELHLTISLMLEAVNFVQSKTTTVLDVDNPETFSPGPKSDVIRVYNEKNVLDRDDDFMDERYSDDDSTELTKSPKLKTVSKIIDMANEYLDTNPVVINASGMVTSFVLNEPDAAYTESISVCVDERFSQIKIRDCDLLVEYQLTLKPWKMGVDFNIWNDNEKADSTISYISSAKFDVPENIFTAEILDASKKLMYRMFEYYGVTPCKKD